MPILVVVFQKNGPIRKFSEIVTLLSFLWMFIYKMVHFNTVLT